MLDIVKRAAEKAGGVTKLASEIGVKHPSLHSWKQIPANRVRDIERVTGIPDYELRPDLFRPPPRTPAGVAA